MCFRKKSNVVYVLQAKYRLTKNDTSGPLTSYVYGSEINGIFSTAEKAKKMGEWLLNQEETNGYKYLSYEIKDYFII